MRQLKGRPADINGQTITSFSLIQSAVNDPDKLPILYQAFKEEGVLSSFLGMKDMYTKGLRDNTTSGPYRVVKSNHVQFAIKMDKRRKPVLIEGPNGTTFDAVDMTRPGYNGMPFKMYLDSNYARPNEVIILGDAARTQLFVYDEREPEEVSGGFCYNVKIVDGIRETWVNPSLLELNNEVAVAMTLYEHDLSVTGSEKYSFDAWGDAYMSLQRVKMSWSGTAAAMGNSETWYEHNGSVGYFTKAEQDMMKRIIQYHEFQIIFGKGTVTMDGNVILRNRLGREIMAGDGVINQGDGAHEYPINREWTIGAIENIMMDLELSLDGDGVKEVIVPQGFSSYRSMVKMFKENGFVTSDNNVEGKGSEKGINNNYKYYEMGDVRIVLKPTRVFDDMPKQYLPDGSQRSSWDAVFIPTGKTDEGYNGIELVQLRPMKTGSVHGIDKGGDGMATSVDGSEKHVLIQSGIVCRKKIIRAFRHVN